MHAMIRSMRHRLGASLLMVGSFTVAILFAASHHLFYAHLNGQTLASVTFTQQVNIAAGTAFAYLVRALLVLAAGTAYTQVLWNLLLKAEHQLSIGTIDSLTCLLSSALELFHLTVTWRYPTLVLLGCVAWVIPFSTIIPPATLSVQSDLHTSYHLQNVTTIDWTRGNDRSSSDGFYARYGVDENAGNNILVSLEPSNSASNLALLTAEQGELPETPTRRVNSSYVVTISGPALQCNKISAPTVLGEWSRVCAISNRNPAPDTPTGYISWFPYVYLPESVMPEHINGTLNCNSLIELARTQDTVFFNQPVQFFDAIQTGPGNATLTDFWSLIRCELQNGTYTVKFSFAKSAEQTVTVIGRTLQPLEPLQHYLGLFLNTTSGTLNHLSLGGKAILSYLTTMTMMKMLVGGVIAGFQPDETIDSQILETQLAFTREFMQFYNQSPYGHSHSEWKQWKPVPDGSELEAKQSLASALEELHQNLTLALFSYGLMTTKTYVSNVSEWRSVNVYVYTQRHLLLSYGLGALVILVAIVYGIYTSLMLTRASYSTRFSTYLRTIHWQNASWLVFEEDDGAEPLPNHIAEGTVKFRQAWRDTDDAAGTDTSDKIGKLA